MIFRRYLSTSLKDVRVRFAPSPTGSIHLGGLRIALYNYIFAWQHKGKFILRLEDTDRTRIVPGAADEIDEVLQWANLCPHESPKKGGDFGPYVQSERVSLYKEKAEELVKSGKAYRCFCSPMRLELLRKFQASQREKPRYDGKCRNLSPQEIDEKLHENKGSHVIRFAITSGKVTYEDGIFGNLTTEFVENLESDPVILKSDSYPTYHFANVVDDHSMKVSHVLRGSEWISSTAKHIQMYQAFNWPHPQYLHFPLITMTDGKKISKRDNLSKVLTSIENGFRPLATLNFLTNMGGGVPTSKQEANELWEFERLMKDFNFKAVTSHPGSLDLDRWKIYNSKDLQKTWKEEPETLVNEFKNLLNRRSIVTDLDNDALKTIIEQFITRIVTLNDLLSHENVYIWQCPTLTWDIEEYKNWNLPEVIEDLIKLVNEIDLENKALFNKEMKEIAKKHNQQDWRALMRLTRRILTNSDIGLPVHDIMICLKKPRLLEYLQNGLKYVDHLS